MKVLLLVLYIISLSGCGIIERQKARAYRCHKVYHGRYGQLYEDNTFYSDDARGICYTSDSTVISDYRLNKELDSLQVMKTFNTTQN